MVRTSLPAALIGLSLVLSGWVGRSMASQPNIVLIYIDDLGYGDLGCYGCRDIPTPNINRLAKEGVRFTASYITNPPCCPSRCSMIMGQYGQRFGKYGMSRGLPIPEDRPTLARLMADNGYVTGQIGKWDIGSKRQGPLETGFMEVARKPPRKSPANGKLDRKSSKYFCINKAGETQWLTDYDGDNVVEFIERHEKKPFFLYWSPEAVHSSNQDAPASLTRRTKAKGKRSKLAGAIVSVDDQVGKLLDVLEKRGLRRNTLVIFSSDNGPVYDDGYEDGTTVRTSTQETDRGHDGSGPFRGGKYQIYEGGTRVPFIVKWPGHIQPGKSAAMVSQIDFSGKQINVMLNSFKCSWV